MKDENIFRSIQLLWLFLLIIFILIYKTSCNNTLNKINSNLEELRNKIEVKLDV